MNRFSEPLCTLKRNIGPRLDLYDWIDTVRETSTCWRFELVAQLWNPFESKELEILLSITILSCEFSNVLGVRNRVERTTIQRPTCTDALPHFLLVERSGNAAVTGKSLKNVHHWASRTSRGLRLTEYSAHAIIHHRLLLPGVSPIFPRFTLRN